MPGQSYVVNSQEKKSMDSFSCSSRHYGYPAPGDSWRVPDLSRLGVHLVGRPYLDEKTGKEGPRASVESPEVSGEKEQGIGTLSLGGFLQRNKVT